MQFARLTPIRVVLLVAAAGALVAVGIALAAPSPGPQHRGTLVQRIRAHSDGVHMKTHGSTDLIAQDIVYHPGDVSGWHYHPGLVLVENEGPGTATFRDACGPTTIPPNASFYETGHEPGQLENNSAADFTIHAMYVLPTGAPPRVNTGPPGSCEHHGHHGHEGEHGHHGHGPRGPHR
jgi:hypothetical protein